MACRIYLANVGANASHRFCGPVFADGTFEFLPIPEDRPLTGSAVVRYPDLRSHYDSGRDLLGFVPRRLWDWPAHSDPEFVTFTYGDNCEVSPRASSLRRIERGDFLFFIARLRAWEDETPRDRHGFFLIGFLEVEEVLRNVTTHPDDATLTRFGANAHVRRGLSDDALWDGFWVFRGSRRSRRFHAAVPVTRSFASNTLASADGSPWRWDGGRTELQVIGSYTRSCRCVIDPAIPGHRRRAEALWEWVARHSGPPEQDPHTEALSPGRRVDL